MQQRFRRRGARLPQQLAGAAMAWLLLDGRDVADIHNKFDLAVSPRLFGIAIAWAIGICVLGGLSPTLRAARLPVAGLPRMVLKTAAPDIRRQACR